VFTRPTKILRPPLAVPPRPGPAPRSPSHLPGLWVTRHQRGFTHVRPSGLPLACAPGWNGTRFGFFPELRTPQLPATHVRAGTGLEHWPGATPPTSSALQSAHSLATCNLVSHDLRPVIHRQHLASLPGSARARLEGGGSVFVFRHWVSFHVPPTDCARRHRQRRRPGMSPGPRNGIGDVDPLADLKPRADRPAVLDQRSQARHWRHFP
jgi:hypothetical protein